MKTGNEIHTLRCRIVQIIPPIKQFDYMITATTRQITEGKYIIVAEYADMPAKGRIKRLIYEYKHRKMVLFFRIVMSVCPYSVGDVIQADVVEILIPSGIYTTEMERT